LLARTDGQAGMTARPMLDVTEPVDRLVAGSGSLGERPSGDVGPADEPDIWED
jgi:hypothetical protein